MSTTPFSSNDGFITSGNITAANLIANTQVVAEDITINGNIFYNPVFGQFYSNVTQNTASNTPTQVTLNNADYNNSVSYNVDGNITIAHAGQYSITATLQLYRGSGGPTVANAFIWFRQNGVDIPNSGYNQIVDKVSDTVTTAVFLANVSANSNVSVMWAQDDTIELVASSANAAGFTMPAIPSAYILITPIGA